MTELCDLKLQINGQHTFYLHQTVICSYSGKIKKMVKQEKKKSQPKNQGLKISDFPGGPEGFELISRFCYNNGRIPITPTTISLLHCSALFLEMTEELSPCNLLTQTEALMDGIFYWSWSDILTSLKTCENFFPIADQSGLVDRLISALFTHISANCEIPVLKLQASGGSFTPLPSSPSCSSSSPDSSSKTPESMKPCLNKEWWFNDLTFLAPPVIEKMMRLLGAYGSDNKNLLLTRFLLHYLRVAVQRPYLMYQQEYASLADTAVHGVVLMGRTSFSCRGLFWVLRVVSNLGFSREMRCKLERLMGLVLDQATLDDLLVSGGSEGGGAVYDVNLVLRLVRVFVSSQEGEEEQKMKKVGKLIDKYLGEISPDQGLKVGKFLGLAESLPDAARDCYDGVYRALDIYLESHPNLSAEERTNLCRCLNYEKLTLEGCKDLAKNRRIPPGIAVQALASQQSKLQINTHSIPQTKPDSLETPKPVKSRSKSVKARPDKLEDLDEKEELRFNLYKMQNRVIELEKVCMEMKGQMSKMVKSKSFGNRSCHQSSSSKGMPRLC